MTAKARRSVCLRAIAAGIDKGGESVKAVERESIETGAGTSTRE